MKANTGKALAAETGWARASGKRSITQRITARWGNLCVILAALGMAQGAVAQQTPVLLPEGQTLITLQVTERLNVAQDLLVADLRIEVEGRDPGEVQSDINAAMAQALEQANGISAVDTNTGRYNVYQVNRQSQNNRPDIIWRGSQSINLQGLDAPALLDLVGELQGMGFVTSQLAYQLSTERADEVRDSLMEAAVAKAIERADRAARALGKSSVDISALDVDNSAQYAPPVMFQAAMAADSAQRAAPVAEAGETEVVLTVRVQAVAR